MHRIVKTIALLTVLNLAAVSCQKETITVDPQSGIEATGTVYTVRYVVNDVTYTETLIGEQAWADFLQRMLALAEDGYRVTVSRNTGTTQYAMSKDVVTFTTKKKTEAYAWSEQMLEDGYDVTISYNPQTGEDTCTAVR